jgi:trigger factor
MKVTKKELPKSQIELLVELSFEEFKPYIDRGAKKVSEEVKIDGFRPGQAPYDIIKQKIGEMTILEESARIAINKTIDEAFKEVKKQPVGQPQVDIVKLAPNNPLEYKVVISIIPEVVLGDYKEAKIKQEKVEVDDKEADTMLENLQEMRAKEVISENVVKNGDKIIVNIEMFLDKVPVEGGQSQNVAVIVGKDYFIPGFDKKLIGAKKEEVREFSLPYPKEHYQKNLAGKMVEFRVKMIEIYNRELPELNDEFAQSFSAKNIVEMKESIKKNVEHEKKQKAEQKAEIEMLDAIINKSKFSEIPEVLIQHESEAMLHELQHGIEQQGGKFDDYLSSLKKTREQFILEMLPDAVKRVKSALVIREIGEKEKIEASDKEVEKEVEKLLKQYKGYEKVEERVSQPSYKAYLKNVITNKKVMEKLREWNVVN